MNLVSFKILFFIFLSQLYFSQLHSFDEESTLTLSNGLKVFLVKDQSSPFVGVSLTICVGSKSDPIEQSGLAHFLEHMITYAYDPKGIALSGIEGSGPAGKGKIVYSNAMTTHNTTSYYGIVESGYEEDFIDQLYRIVSTKVKVAKEKLEVERSAVISEMSLKGNLITSFYDEMLLASGLKEKFARNVIGYKDQVNNIDAENMDNFLEKYYLPSNAKILVFGNFDVKKMSEHIMQKWDLSRNTRPNKIENVKYISEEKPDCRVKLFKKQKNIVNDFFLFSIPIDISDLDLSSFIKLDLISKVFSTYCKDPFSETGESFNVFSNTILSKIGLKSCSIQSATDFIAAYIPMTESVKFDEVENVFEDFFKKISENKIDDSDMRSLKFSYESDVIYNDGFLNNFIYMTYFLPLIDDVFTVDKFRPILNSITSEDLKKFFIERVKLLYNPVLGFLSSAEEDNKESVN